MVCHWHDEANKRCGDCGAHLCRYCSLTLDDIGVLCEECALVRAGIRVPTRDNRLARQAHQAARRAAALPNPPNVP